MRNIVYGIQDTACGILYTVSRILYAEYCMRNIVCNPGLDTACGILYAILAGPRASPGRVMVMAG